MGPTTQVDNSGQGKTTQALVLPFLINESRLTPRHLPFHNYAGPGTHVAYNVLNGVEPVGVIDAAALIHDIEYTSDQISQSDADENMISNIERYGIPIIPSIISFCFRVKDVFGYSPETNHKVAILLKSMAKPLLADFPKMHFVLKD